MTPETHLIGLDCDASAIWLRDHNYSLPYEQGFAFNENLRTPRESSRQQALVLSIFTWLPTDGECILLVTDWGIWGPDLGFALFDHVRNSLGISRPVHEVPGQIIRLADRPALECLLDVCLYNMWDALLGDGDHRFLIQFSHDQFIQFAGTPYLESDMRRTLGLFTIP